VGSREGLDGREISSPPGFDPGQSRDAPVYQIYLFRNDTLHVSDGLSVHHQEFKTVHTATSICQTDDCCCMYSFELLTTDGKTVRNM